MRCDEAQELITARVDNELGVDERANIDAHLKSCAECARSFEQESLLKRRIHLISQQISAPVALRRVVEEKTAASAAAAKRRSFFAGFALPRWPRVLGAAAKPAKRVWRDFLLSKLRFLKKPQLDEVSKEGEPPLRSPTGFAPRSGNQWISEASLPAWRCALVATIILVIGISVFYTDWRTQKEENFALSAFAVHSSILSGKTTLLRAVNLAAMRNEMAHAVGNRFRPVVLDLSMMNFHPIAGFVQNIGGRDLLVTVYHGDGSPITCFTFLGSDADALAGAERFFDAEMKVAFYSFSRGDVNGVLHQEGEVMCLLVSKMAPAQLLALLRGKSAHA